MRRHTSDPVTRRAIVAGLSTFLAGCIGDGGSDGPNAEEGDEPNAADGTETRSGDGVDATGDVAQLGELSLTSPAFDDGDRIPDRYGRAAANVNPPLEIAGVPDDAESLALVVDDPDAVEPAGEVWDHWIVWNVPPTVTTVPEGWDPAEAGAAAGTNDFGERGYDGPDPPDGTHRYRFKLFALDATLELPLETDAADLDAAMDGHVVAATQFEGTYPA